ncbi:MAG TPA: hypothetical protein VIZ67_05585 [Acidimicrobiales bacterium]
MDRPTARPSRLVRALVLAAGVLGVGLIVLAVQQLSAEPAGADSPGLVDGVVGTVDQVVDEVLTDARPVEPTANESPAELPAADVAERPAEPLAPVFKPLAPVVAPLAGAASPVAEAAAPVVEAVAPVTTSVVEAAAPVVAPLVEAAAPLVAPLVEAVTPVAAPVVRALPGLVEALDPVVIPVVGALGPVVDSVIGGGAGPWMDRSDVAPLPGDARGPDAASAERAGLPIDPRAGPLPVLRAWSAIGTGGNAPGRDSAAPGVPPGPLALPVPSAGPGGLGASASGGGSSVLLAILAGGVPGLSLARSGVVRDRAARLIGLVHGPGRLPG